MASATPTQSKGKGRKSLDLELNLVPFIDLLSCLISFLLITAVWTQVSAVPAQTTGNLDGPRSLKHPVRVTIGAAGYSVESSGSSVTIARIQHDGRLSYDATQLAFVVKAVPRDSDDRTVSVLAEDGVAYEDLAEAMDRIASIWLPGQAEITVGPVAD